MTSSKKFIVKLASTYIAPAVPQNVLRDILENRSIAYHGPGAALREMAVELWARREAEPPEPPDRTWLKTFLAQHQGAEYRLEHAEDGTWFARLHWRDWHVEGIHDLNLCGSSEESSLEALLQLERMYREAVIDGIF